MNEYHLFIIWEHARTHEKEILRDIADSFDITHIFDIKWSKKHFPDNLSRFYGTNLPPGSDKEAHVGRGRFLVVLVDDKEPNYNHHETSRGVELVNSRTFSSKAKYRNLTGGGHKIHATNNKSEFSHDLFLLLSMNIEGVHKKYGKVHDETIFIDKDLVGAEGWNNLEEVFNTLNETIEYVVMRNYTPLPEEYYSATHGDIDFLVRDYQNAQFILRAQPVFSEPYRVHNKIVVDRKEVLLDLRYIGDNYYDTSWQENILKTKLLYNNLYVMDEENHFYSLLYHALVHKPSVGDDYVSTLRSLNKNLAVTHKEINKQWFTNGSATTELGVYLANKQYAITQPEQSVYYNEDTILKINEVIRYEHVKKELEFDTIKPLKKPSYLTGSQHYKASKNGEYFFVKSDSHDFKHEYTIAKKLYEKNEAYFIEPVRYYKGRSNYLVAKWDDGISLEQYMAKGIADEKIKEILIQDLYEISKLLYDADIVHRDIIPRNFMVSSGRLKIIDFHYAVEYSNYQELDYVKNNINSVRLLGESFAAGEYKWDDAFSFVKIASYILGDAKSKKHPLVKKIESKIDSRIITPSEAIFSENIVALHEQVGKLQQQIGKKEKQISDQWSTLQGLQDAIAEKDSAIAQISQRVHGIERSISYRIGRKITLPYRLLKTKLLSSSYKKTKL